MLHLVQLVERLEHFFLERLVVHREDLLEAQTDQLHVAQGIVSKLVCLRETVHDEILLNDRHQPLVKQVGTQLLHGEERGLLNLAIGIPLDVFILFKQRLVEFEDGAEKVAHGRRKALDSLADLIDQAVNGVFDVNHEARVVLLLAVAHT